MNQKRVNRISSEINKVISHCLYNTIKDPNLDPLYTGITGVNVTNDLSFATVYISVIGDDEKKANTIKGFENAKGYLKREISKNVKLRHIPELIFKIDDSTERGMHIENIINELNKTGNANE
ncbi:30S ribosome-binding factor RbfA [Miniphocaeibacter halophilus]|uniref:30S ribosome-binding factor RbfA n=1 Tax=Miniphocaeibacter halophilus TaxID=2931922 RepID=A0AC61MPY9_9FIRM|nr:30S ribosome-binding factor RbfA [Miniphocaeibacter halophilus]QQK07630.1 30S ribosome-binding factor RbfA [Miniphocaeibacter halophilus]